nr:MAG TPA: hypothetical protein [Crassvirales sp.]
MGNIVGKQFRVVASKDYATALAESVKEGNQAKFYLAQKDGKALDGVTATTYNDRNTLIINGNGIQGVSNNDISKLDAITDVTKLFKYKGSVDTFDDLPTGTLRDVSVGDVWNIKSNFTLEDVTYPAYTNVVCVVAAYGSAPVIKWDALGGTMEMGTSVAPTVKDSILSYKTKNNIPISSFAITLGSDTGIMADAGGTIRLDLSTALSEKFNNNTLKFSGDSRPVERFQIDVDTTHGIYITKDKKIGLLVTNAATTATTPGGAFGDSLLQIGNGLTPIAAFNIKTGNGLRIETQNDNEIGLNISTNGLGIDNNKQLYLSLSTDSGANIYESQYEYCKEGGLCIDSNGGLRIAVATHYNSNRGDIIEGGIVIGSGYNDPEGMKYHGGLCISSKAIAQFVMKNANIAGYINSLIDARLQAQ